VTSLDSSGTVLVNGAKVFPIVLAKGPPRGATTPSGADGLREVVDAGVNVLKVGPATTPTSPTRSSGIGPRPRSVRTPGSTWPR